MGIRRAIGPVVAIVLVVACGTQDIWLYAWNRSQQAYVLRVGDDASDTCYRIDPGGFGQFYEAVGDIGEGGTRPLRLYTADGQFMSNLGPRTQTDIFVINADGSLDLVAARFEGPQNETPRLLDLPQFPEIDGRRAPDFLPTTEDICTP